ncbi:MAG: Gldg family protein [bacterium]|nr:Gldg family protein [bacterium]
MKSIFTFAKRELKSHFDHPGGYIILVVFLGLVFFFYFRSTLVVSEASLRPLFNFLPWLLLFLVPAITMRSLAADEKEGTSEVFLSQPVSPAQYLLGKYLGAFATIMLGVFATLPALLVLAKFGSFDWGLVAAQYLGTVFLVSGLCAIGFFASGLTKNQIVAFILSIAIIFFFIVIGWEAAIGSVSAGISSFMQQMSILWHFSNITRGVIDLRDVVYFLSLTTLFGSFAYIGFMRKRLTRFSSAWRSINSWVLALVALVVVWNGAVSFISFRFDLTSGRLYTLSQATKTLVAGLAEPLTIKLYASQNLPTELIVAQRDVTDMLNDYRSVSKGKILIEQAHPESDTEKQEAVNSGVPPIQFNVVRKGEFQVKEGFFGLTISQKDKRAEVIPYISQTADFEYQLSRLIHRFADESKKTVAFLEGHNEISTDGYSALRGELANAFDIESVSLLTATSLSSSALAYSDILVVAGPTQALSQNEENLITEYLKGGGRAFFLVDGVQLDFRSLTASPSNTSLPAFIEKTLGVKINPSVVYDLRANENVQFNTGGPLTFVLPYPFWARVGAASDTPVTKDLKSIVYSWGASLEIPQDKAVSSEATPLLKTSPFAGEQRNSFMLQPNQEFAVDRSALGERTVAVLIKNILGGTGRAIVLGSSSMLSDQVIGGKPENIAFGLNAIDWLAENEGLISIRSKTASSRPLTFASSDEQTMVQYGIMIGIPLLAVLFGTARLFLRRQKTKMAF